MTSDLLHHDLPGPCVLPDWAESPGPSPGSGLRLPRSGSGVAGVTIRVTRPGLFSTGYQLPARPSETSDTLTPTAALSAKKWQIGNLSQFIRFNNRILALAKYTSLSNAMLPVGD